MAKKIRFNPTAKKIVATTVLSIACVILVLAVLVVGLALSTYFPRRGAIATDYESEISLANQFIKEDPAVIGHRIAGNIAPENTIKAFEVIFDNFDEYPINAFEFDVRITKDGQLVLVHDKTLDRVSDAEELGFGGREVSTMTLTELKSLNMGFKFQDKDGNYPYVLGTDKELENVRIPTLFETLSYIELRAKEYGLTLNDFVYNIELKDKGVNATNCVMGVYNLVRAFEIIPNTLIEGFGSDVGNAVDTLINKEGVPVEKRLVRAASQSEMLTFYLNCMFNIDLEGKDLGYSVLCMPTDAYGFNLAKKAIVDYAHKYGIAVQYWTIDDPVDIVYLTDIGADGIITDEIATAYKLIK